MKLLVVLALCVVPALCARVPHIIGGNNVPYAGKWPWQASLQRSSSHICGASLISDTWLVTAAHCVGSAASMYSIILGMHDRVSRRQGDPTLSYVDSITIHPLYDFEEPGFPNDIAIIRLKAPANLDSEYISTVQLADDGEDFLGANCYISGWGRFDKGSNQLPDVLQESKVEVITDDTCRELIPFLGGWHLCIRGSGTSSACQGDSGGPLSCEKDGVWKLAGAASFVFGNCWTNFPNVYTRVSYFRSWIQQNTGV